ncbi:MAG: 50S ribosomal protein L9 [Firmicutes bacterium]|nr:50S ribosomal protein L9 [Bacillota bacterium]
MKVILKQDVKSLGEKDSIIEVKDGYARNYLLPKGLAVEATEGNLSIIRNRKEAEKLKKDKELENAKALAGKLNNTVITIKTKAGESGKLFGSITSMDIAESLQKSMKINIDKKKIHLPEAIKSLGTYEVEVKFYAGVSALLKVNIEQE